MSDSFEVVQSSPDDGLSEEQRHEVVAAQLRGEAKAEGQSADAVVASVAAELEEIGLEPDPSELHTGAASSTDSTGADGPVAAGVDASREHPPVDDPEVDQTGR